MLPYLQGAIHNGLLTCYEHMLAVCAKPYILRRMLFVVSQIISGSRGQFEVSSMNDTNPWRTSGNALIYFACGCNIV